MKPIFRNATAVTSGLILMICLASMRGFSDGGHGCSYGWAMMEIRGECCSATASGSKVGVFINQQVGDDRNDGPMYYQGGSLRVYGSGSSCGDHAQGSGPGIVQEFDFNDGGTGLLFEVTLVDSGTSGGYPYYYEWEGLITAPAGAELKPGTATISIQTYNQHPELECAKVTAEIVVLPPGSELPFAGPSYEVNSLDFRLGLGRGSTFSAAGFLQLYKEGAPDANLAKPQSLSLPSADLPGVAVFPGSGDIEQIKIPDGLLTVTVDSATQFTIRAYDNTELGAESGGEYDQSGQDEFASWTIKNLGSPYYDLWITEHQDGVADRTFKYKYASGDDSWSLTQADGQSTVKAYSTTASSPTRRTDFREHYADASQTDLLSYESEEYELIDGQYKLTQLIQGDSSVDVELVTDYEYYSNTGNGNAYQLKRVDYPDGNWEYYEYDSQGRVSAQYSAWKDETAPAGAPTNNNYRKTVYAYSLASGTDGVTDDADYFQNTPRKVIEYLPYYTGSVWQLKEVSRRYLKITGGYGATTVTHEARDFHVPGKLWYESGYLATTTVFHSLNPEAAPDPDDFKGGRIESIIRPDGTVVEYGYTLSSGVLTTEHYQGSDGTGGLPIKDGTKTVTEVENDGRIDYIYRYAVTNNVVGVMTSKRDYTYLSGDPQGEDYKVVDLAGLSVTNTFGIHGPLTSSDLDGVTTEYHYDENGRQTGHELLVHGLGHTSVLDAAGRLVASFRVGSDDSEILQSGYSYDTAGRMLTETNALLGVINITNNLANGYLIVTNTYPDNGISIERYHKDGRLYETSGSAVADTRYEYGVEDENSDGIWRAYTKTILLTDGGGTSEWFKTYYDGLGREYKTVYAAASGSPAEQVFFNSNGQVVREQDPDGVEMLYQYDAQGKIEYQALNMNNDDSITFGGLDRITSTVSDYLSYASTDVLRTRQWVYDTNSNSNSTNLVSTVFRSHTGLKTWTLTPGQTATTSHITVYDTANGSRTETVTRPDLTSTVSEYSYGRLAAVSEKANGGSQLQKTTYQYDEHGRLENTIDDRNGTTTYYYNSADLVTGIVTPSPDGIQAGQVTTTIYDDMGRVEEVIHPDGSSVYHSYYPTGLLEHTYGSRTYPVLYDYDEQGRMTSMITYQSFSGFPGSGQETEWTYDTNRGWLTQKEYPDGNNVDYTYTDGGRLATRAWQRSVTTTYAYGFDVSAYHGDLVDIDYSDTTPDVAYTYNRKGQLSTVVQDTDGGGASDLTTTRTYNDAGLLLTESYANGTLNNLSVTNTYYSSGNTHALKRQYVAAKRSSDELQKPAFVFDSGGRLSTVTANGHLATYTYEPNSPLVSTITFNDGTDDELVTTRNYDFLNRLSSVSSDPDGETMDASYAYQYNAANQRNRTTMADGSYWIYGYDDLGQVTDGKRYWRSGVPVAGQQFEYAFDDIGNRTSTKTGGDENGSNLRSASYTTNSNNQYTLRDVPGYIEVMGIAKATATVTVEGSSSGVYRHGEYFRKELSYSNASTAHYPTIDIDTNVTDPPESGKKFLAEDDEIFGYDGDGNLTSDGRWNYEWDAENRLEVMRSLSGSPASERRIEFEYDWMGRRIRKTVWNDRDNGQGSEISDTIYLYDGWNLLAELNANDGNDPVNSYVWGLDLSGSEQGAGGVGGLLMVVEHDLDVSYDADAWHFAAHDGNGNVAALVKATDGKYSARYEYGPFGENIRGSGDLAAKNPFRFSTKYTDNESGLCYYGLRYYNSSIGRWLSKDPIGELGGKNIYSIDGNNLISYFDYLGMRIEWHHMLPQAVFKEFIENGLIDGLTITDIDDPKYGWMLDQEEHLQMHGKGRNFEDYRLSWKRWLTDQTRNGQKVSKELIHSRLAWYIRKSEYSVLFKVGVRASVRHGSQWKSLRAEAKQKVEARITKLITQTAAKKGTKSGVKSVPLVGWGAAAAFFVCDLFDPDVSFGAAVQSNLPYYGVAYDINTIYEQLGNMDAVVEKELTHDIYTSGDRNPPDFGPPGTFDEDELEIPLTPTP